MKKLLLITAAGAATLGLSLANAAATHFPATSTLSVQEVQDTSYKDYRTSLKAYLEFRGSYAMEDGSTLSLYRQGRTFHAELTGHPDMEIRATSADKFVATNGGAEIAFKQYANGVVSQVVLTRNLNGRLVSLRGGMPDKA